jgi:hypothetical protein
MPPSSASKPPSSASKKTPASDADGLGKEWVLAIRRASDALEDDNIEFEETIDNVTLTYANGGIQWSCHGHTGPVEGVRAPIHRFGSKLCARP